MKELALKRLTNLFTVKSIVTIDQHGDSHLGDCHAASNFRRGERLLGNALRFVSASRIIQRGCLTL